MKRYYPALINENAEHPIIAMIPDNENDEFEIYDQDADEWYVKYEDVKKLMMCGNCMYYNAITGSCHSGGTCRVTYSFRCCESWELAEKDD